MCFDPFDLCELGRAGVGSFGHDESAGTRAKPSSASPTGHTKPRNHLSCPMEHPDWMPPGWTDHRPPGCGEQISHGWQTRSDQTDVAASRRLIKNSGSGAPGGTRTHDLRSAGNAIPAELGDIFRRSFECRLEFSVADQWQLPPPASRTDPATSMKRDDQVSVPSVSREPRAVVYPNQGIGRVSLNASRSAPPVPTTISTMPRSHPPFRQGPGERSARNRGHDRPPPTRRSQRIARPRTRQ